MIKKVLFVTLIAIMIAQFTFADGFNLANEGNSKSNSVTFISEYMNYILSLEYDSQKEDSKYIPDSGTKPSHRRGHRIRRKVDDEKGIDNNHN